MKRIRFFVTLAGLLVLAAPVVLAQNPKNKGKEDEQSLPVGTPRGKQEPPRPMPKAQPPVQRPPAQPPVQRPAQPLPRAPQDDPRPPKPQGKPSWQQPGNQQPGNQGDPRRSGPPSPPSGQPVPRELPRTPQDDPRPPKPQGKPSWQQPGNQQPGNQGDPRRVNPPKVNPPSPKQQLPPTGPAGGNAPKIPGRDTPRSVGKPEQPKSSEQPGPFSRRPDLGPPGKAPSTHAPGKPTNPTPDLVPPARGSDVNRKRSVPITPSGKRLDVESAAPKRGGVAPGETGNVPGASPGPRKPLGKPSQPEGFAATAKKGEAGSTPPLAATASPHVKGVEAPAKLRKVPRKESPPESSGDPDRVKPRRFVQPEPVKPLPVVQPVAAPAGGRFYDRGSYHHEYSPRSSWSVGLGLSSGGSSLAFGYSSGGWGAPYGAPIGHSAHWGAPWGWNHWGYAPACYHPYWHHPCWYSPVVYQPCYAVVAPVYCYSPVYYESVVYDPVAYNASSFAFGFSSFGGSALSSFSFAYSSSNWGIGFGWTSAPAYTIYTPVYDPYVRAVWVDGYYDIASERAWVPGGYDEVVSTPVVETVVDPLGNTYDAVLEAGSVDYLWRDGYWTVEQRRIWHPGHFEYVSAF